MTAAVDDGEAKAPSPVSLATTSSSPPPPPMSAHSVLETQDGFSRVVLTVALASYEGDLDDDGLHSGTGTARFKGGATYSGEWRRGAMHGQGTYTWPDGTLYEGSFVDNTLTGVGTYLWEDGSRYDGDVVE